MSSKSFKDWSVQSDIKILDKFMEDYEFSMARSELKTAQAAISRLMKKLSGEGDLEAWIQSKITKAADYIDTVADYLDSGESETTKEGYEIDEELKSHLSVEQIAKKHRIEPSFVENQLKMGIEIEHEHVTDKDTAMDIALQHLNEFPDYYTRLKKMESDAKKKVKESVEICDVDGNTFVTITDLIKGTEDKFQGFSNLDEKKGLWDNIHARRKKGLPPKKPGEKGYPKTLDIDEDLKQARKNVGASKCWSGKVAKGTKMKGGREVPNCVPVEENNKFIEMRFCPLCNKNEKRHECSYGPRVWDQYSVKNLDQVITDRRSQFLGMREDYQKIQSSGKSYTILFSWRGRSMQTMQMFFPSPKNPTKNDIAMQLEKVYPGARVLSYYPSVADPTKPIIMIQSKE